MTERETLEKCRDMWKLLIDVTDSIHAVKRQAAKKIADPGLLPAHSCFCCEFVRGFFGVRYDGGMACSSNISTTRGRSMLKCCPLHELWPNGCEADDSVYELWYSAICQEDFALASSYARKIVGECERLLKFTNEKTTESAEVPSA